MIKITNPHNMPIGHTVMFKGTGEVIVGKGAQIRDYTIIEMNEGKVYIGERSIIGYYCFLQATGNIHIGNDTMIGPRCSLIASHHEIGSNGASANIVRGNIIIGNNVWLGGHVLVNDGVIIEDKSVVGACSFVNKKVETGLIVGGVPSRNLKRLK